MRRFSLCASLATLVLLGSLPIAGGGCASSTQPVSRANMVNTAIFENKVLSQAENRLMDAFDLGLLDPKLHDELNPSVQGARLAANDMTRIANTKGAKRSAFDLALDQFVAFLAPIVAANAQADTKSLQAHDTGTSTGGGLRLAAPSTRPSRTGYVPPSVGRSINDASRFNAPPGR